MSKAVYYGATIFGSFYAVLNIFFFVWGLGALIGENAASDACGDQAYWYLLARTIAGFLFGVWFLLTNLEAGTWDYRLDIFEGLTIIFIMVLWFWEAVILGGTSTRCYNYMADNYPWVWYTSIVFFTIDICYLFVMAFASCLCWWPGYYYYDYPYYYDPYYGPYYDGPYGPYYGPYYDYPYGPYRPYYYISDPQRDSVWKRTLGPDVFPPLTRAQASAYHASRLAKAGIEHKPRPRRTSSNK